MILGIVFITSCSDDNDKDSPKDFNGIYSTTSTEQVLDLRYSDAVFIGKSVDFNSADGKSATLKLQGVVPGESETVFSDLQLVENNSVYTFAAENKNTYGALASLELAQQFVDQNELEKAASQLQQGLAATSDENLKAVINLRLARVQVQLKQADTALKTLETIKGEGWAAIVADLRGEALLSKGDKQGARSAWEAGVKSDASPALSEMMQMKINNLSI